VGAVVRVDSKKPAEDYNHQGGPKKCSEGFRPDDLGGCIGELQHDDRNEKYLTITNNRD
jgi:hypothetical protein